MNRKWQLAVLIVLCVASAGASFANPTIASLLPASGAVGESVTISGANFGATQDISTVMFNSVMAMPTSWNDASIVVPLPAGATSGIVVVKVGGVASNAVAFSVYSGYTSGYQYRRTIVLDHTKVSNSNQTDFPVLISGVYPYLANVSNGGLVQSSNGYDMVFSSDPEGATQLDQEIDSYDPVTGTVKLWVRIPTLSPTVDTVIYLFYGNPSVTVSQENKAGVWRNGFVSIYHLSNGTTLSTADSLNANAGINQGATATTGMIGGAGEFNGASSYIELPAAAFGDYPTSGSTTNYSLSLETWFKTASGGVILGQIDAGTTPGGSLSGCVPSIYVDTNGDVRADMFYHNAGQLASSGTYNDNQWHSLLDTYSNGTETLYVDGHALGTQNATELSYAPAYRYFLGVGGSGGWPSLAGTWSYFNGALDEARISNVTRSANWVATEYANESSPSTFYAVESQATPSSAPTIEFLSPAYGRTGAVVTIQGYGFQSRQAASTVTFNDVTATPTSWSDASIVVPVPAGATSGNVVVTVGGVASNAVAFGVEVAYPSGYGYRRTIVLDHAKVASSDQTDFPVLISGGYPYLANIGSGGSVRSASGFDIIFSSDPEGATRLDHEIDSYDPTTGTVSFWARIPTLSHTVDTVIYLFYGNPGVTVSQENKAGVWKNNYLSVYHLGNGSTIGLADSGSAGYNLLGSAPAATGKIGGAAAFNGNPGTYLYFDSVTAYPSGESPVTLETWVQFAPSGNAGEILGYGANSANGSRDALYWDGSSVAMELENMAVAGPLPFDNNWHHLASVYGGGVLTTGSDQLYLDGAPLSTSTTGGSPAITTTEFKIGGIPMVTFCCALNGSVDEVRVSSGTRSADWVATEYANQSSPSTFYTVEGQATGNSAPTIQYLSPSAATSRSTVAIQGYGFQSTQGTSTVTFNGLTAAPLSWNDATIVVSVPTGATTGNVVVTVGGVASNGVTFTVLPFPSITNLNPALGEVGTPVTIAGTNFGFSQGSSAVTFNGVTAVPTSWQATSITAPVPAGATSGNVVVTVGGGSSNGVNFTIPISGISPQSGMVGTFVTISGSGFGALQGASTVSLNAIPASVATWTKGSIVAIVPAGATSGPFSVTINGQTEISPPFTVTTLPSGWADGDVGSVSLAGSATFSGGTFTVTGAGGGIGGTTDAMHFVYQTLAGDGSIIARLTSLQSTPNSFFGGAGVMIRETLNPAAVDASVFDGYYNMYLFMEDRPWTGATASLIQGPYVNALPYWLQLVRSGNTFTGYVSSDGVNWTQNGASATVTMAQTVDIGLTVSGGSLLQNATFDSVSVNSTATPAPVITGLSATTASVGTQVEVTGNNFGATQGGSFVVLNGTPMTINSWTNTRVVFTVPVGATSGQLMVSVAPSMNDSNPVYLEVTTQPLPSPWMNQDVGAALQAGNSTFNGGTFTVTGVGNNARIGGTADSMQFAYQTLTGDGSIVARVTSVQNNANGISTQFAVMIRETLNPNAAEASMIYGANGGYLDFQYRPATGVPANEPQGLYCPNTFPEWIKLVRTGDTFTGFTSPDGVNWAQQGSATVPMAQTVYVGLAVSGWASLEPATFDSVSISSTTSPAPVITGLSSTTASVGSQIAITGNNFGTVQGGSAVVLNGTPLPINLWSNTSIVFTIQAGAASGQLVVSVAPSMNDSNPVYLEVTTQPLPSPWMNQDVGAALQAGNSTFSGGTFTVTGVGNNARIGGTADSMQFAYQTLTGDGSIVARVTSVQNNANGISTQFAVMIRETLNPNAAEASMIYGANGGYLDFQDRPTTGAGVNEPQGLWAANTFPEWMKLVRTGNTFTGFTSPDGINWTQQGSATVPMAQTVYVGLAVSGWASLEPATFDNVVVTNGTTPFVSGLAPIVGTIGTPVTIAGANFGTSQGSTTITFNGALATSVTSWSSSQIVAKVPSSAPNGIGPVTITVNSIPSPVTAGSMFTVINPVIAGLEPSTGPLNGTVTIGGFGFGQYGGGYGSSLVSINGVSVPIATCPNGWPCWSDTQIKVLIPITVFGGGAVTLPSTFPVIVTSGGFASNSVPFTITSPPVITNLSPTTGEPGTVITIGGSGFGAAQSTSTAAVGGIYAQVASWSDTEIVASVPSIAMNGNVTVTVAGITAQGPLFIFNAINRLTASNGAVTTYSSGNWGGGWFLYNSAGPGCSICSARGNILNTFDDNGNLLTTTDANGNTITYTYDGNNNMLSQAAQLNGQPATTSYTYNNFAEVLTVTDPLGNTTTNTYDAKGNLLSVTSPAPNGKTPPSTTQFTYDNKGELTQILDPLNHPTTISYNTTGLILSITDARYNVTGYNYDPRGNRTSVVDPINGSAHPTTFAYDLMNRLTGITYPDNTTASFGYDARGRRTSATDQNNKTTIYSYDDADRLLSVTDAANTLTQYGYDTEGNLTSITDGNNHTTYFSYDTMGRVTQTTFPSTLTETYTYDQLYNLTSKTDRKNQTIQYVYDSLYRMTSKTYPDSTAANYVYDLVGKIQQVTDPTGAYGFAYDNMGRLIGTGTQYAFLPGHNFQNGYNYDAASNRTSLTAPDNSNNTYQYDTLNRLTTLTNSLTGRFGFGYDALSRRTQLTRPNGVNTNYAYDSVSHLLSVLHQAGSTTIDGASYGYDSAGNRTSKTNYLNGITSNYGYDAIYELQQVTQGGSTTESYSYDAVGNRVSSSGVPTYSYNPSNELTSNSLGTYTYDANGNTLTDSSGKQYSWDFENRLTQAINPGVGTTTFRYDPFGRRIQKSGPLGTTNYLYDGLRAIEDVDGSGSILARYTAGGGIDEPLAELISTTASYYEQDALNSVTSLSNSTGALANTYTFDSFGKVTTSTGTIPNRFQYTGREFDQETGVSYYRARYMDPSTGRFFSEDPVRFFQGPNFYHYVDNNPLNLTDANGLQAQRPNNLPLGTPQQYWGPFADGFAEALNRLNNTNCAEQFEPSCHEGPQTAGATQMQNTTYRFVPLPQGPGAGAQTVDPTNVQINSLGLYMTAANGGIRLPNGFTCNLGSVTNVRAFILLHELGHQLSGNTGFTPDVDAATNSGHSMRIIKACFQCGN